MSVEQQNVELVQWYIENGVNANDLDKLLSVFREDSIDHSAPPGIPQGPAGVAMLFGMFFEGFPGIWAEVEDVLAEGDLIGFHSTVRGKHTGTFMGIPATGKEIEIRVLEMVRIEDGKIVEHWGGFDNFAMMQQLGVIPSMGG
jgi:predicted ester cyclase